MRAKERRPAEIAKTYPARKLPRGPRLINDAIQFGSLDPAPPVPLRGRRDFAAGPELCEPVTHEDHGQSACIRDSSASIPRALLGGCRVPAGRAMPGRYPRSRDPVRGRRLESSDHISPRRAPMGTDTPQAFGYRGRQGIEYSTVAPQKRCNSWESICGARLTKRAARERYGGGGRTQPRVVSKVPAGRCCRDAAVKGQGSRSTQMASSRSHRSPKY